MPSLSPESSTSPLPTRLHQLAPIALAVVAGVIGWRVVTADRVSATGLQWMPVAPSLLVVWSLARRRWGCAAIAIVAAASLYAGPGLGGLIGITLVVVGIGLSAAALAVVVRDELYQQSLTVGVKRRNNREVV